MNEPSDRSANPRVNRIDAGVENWLAGRRGFPSGAALWELGSRGGDLLPVILLLREARRPGGWKLGVTVLVQALVVNFLVKNLFDRPRPKPHGRTSSFPSGHAATAAATALGLAGRGIPQATGLAAGAAITGAARLGKGVHWLSDVIAGIAIGAAVGLIARKLSSD